MDVDYNICTNCSESCCTYKKEELEYTPTFTKDEVERIEKKFGKLNCFKPYNKSKTIFEVKPVKSKKFDYYICPFFDEKTKACKVHKLRGFDCRLFPFTFVRINKKVYLSWVDRDLCPYLKNANSKVLESLKKKVFKDIEKEKIIGLLKKYPDLIEDFDEEDNISVVKEFKI